MKNKQTTPHLGPCQVRFKPPPLSKGGVPRTKQHSVQMGRRNTTCTTERWCRTWSLVPTQFVHKIQGHGGVQFISKCKFLKRKCTPSQKRPFFFYLVVLFLRLFFVPSPSCPRGPCWFSSIYRKCCRRTWIEKRILKDTLEVEMRAHKSNQHFFKKKKGRVRTLQGLTLYIPRHSRSWRQAEKDLGPDPRASSQVQCQRSPVFDVNTCADEEHGPTHCRM